MKMEGDLLHETVGYRLVCHGVTSAYGRTKPDEGRERRRTDRAACVISDSHSRDVAIAEA